MKRLIIGDAVEQRKPPNIGDIAPDFTLHTEAGEEWKLSAQLGKVVALLFYPQDETMVCTRQLCSVRDNWTDYLKTKATVVGVSPGTVEEHRNFSLNHRLPLPLLADRDREITRIYARHWMFPIWVTRGVVIDAKGVIRYRKIMPRVFRPTDYSVIAAIYAAKTDATYEKMDELIRRHRNQRNN